jgi:endogenous inhibitor of DNA gyrase (YacG/DUF329 family)
MSTDPTQRRLAPRTVRCPACGGPSVYAPENSHRPFCNARCRQQDLGAWASEQYRIEKRAREDELDAPPAPSG